MDLDLSETDFDDGKDEDIHDQLLPSDKKEFPGYLTHKSIWKLYRQHNPGVLYVLSVAVLGAIIMGIWLTWWPRKLEWTSCGTTATEARMNNCHYEPMQRSWIPDACYFEEPSSEYDPFSNRKWFADENMTIPSNLARLRSGDEEMAYTKYFHNEHCLYAWRKLALAVEQRRDMLDSKSYDLHHTTHCALGIAQRLVHSERKGWSPDDGSYTESPLMFQTCVPLL